MLLSLVSHLVSVVTLHQLCLDLFGTSDTALRRAFIAAALHVVAPAGLFLCAPYGESPFSALSFLGALSYLRAIRSPSRLGRLGLVIAGLTWGVACTVRSNGVLVGIVFTVDLATTLQHGLGSLDVLVTRLCLVIGGSLVGAGFALPQVIAYVEYCGVTQSRPWCSDMPPSVYSFVQTRYWCASLSLALNSRSN